MEPVIMSGIETSLFSGEGVKPEGAADMVQCGLSFPLGS